MSAYVPPLLNQTAIEPRGASTGGCNAIQSWFAKQIAPFLQADDQEFMDWEQKTAIKRSEGTFFQNLYRIKKELPGAQAAAAVNTEVRIAFLMSIMSNLACVIAPSTALIRQNQVSVSILAKQSLLSCHWCKTTHVL